MNLVPTRVESRAGDDDVKRAAEPEIGLSRGQKESTHTTKLKNRVDSLVRRQNISGHKPDVLAMPRTVPCTNNNLPLTHYELTPYNQL